MGKKSKQYIAKHGGLMASSVAGPGGAEHYSTLTKAQLADKIGTLEQKNRQLEQQKTTTAPTPSSSSKGVNKKALWRVERRMIRNNLHAKGYKKNMYPPNAKPPKNVSSTADYLHVLQNSDFYKAAPGWQRDYNEIVKPLKKKMRKPRNHKKAKPIPFANPRKKDEPEDFNARMLTGQGKKSNQFNERGH
jgi:hypothetical protein